MNNQEILQLLNQPLSNAQKISQFSHFQSTKADMQQWLEGLHALNMADISKQMRSTLIELAHLNADANERLEYMEMLRLGTHNLIRSLNRHYLSQSLVLDNKGVSIAALVQQMRAYSFVIYNNITNELNIGAPEKKSGGFGLGSLFKRGGDNKLALSVHRAINELTGLLFETKLLYFSVYTGIWKNLNTLYTLAKTKDLLEQKFDNATNRLDGQTSIQDEYMRAVILSISQTNRLRQTEIKNLYDQSENWSSLITISDTPSADELFLIDLDKDAAPMYITTSSALSGRIIYINAKNLINHLKALSDGKVAALLHPSEKPLLKTNLVNFVVTSISEPLERSFARHALKGNLTVTMGLLAVHYHLAGRRQFGTVIKLKELMKQEEQSSILMDKSHHFDDTDLSFAQDEDGAKVDKNYLKELNVEIVNVSPGGYRVTWKGGVLPVLKTGEIISLRESSDQPWQIGIIRWVEQNPGSGADFGIEVLSAKGTACGVTSARLDEAGSNYMRAILLPEVKSLNRPATILTPNFNFQIGHRIKIRVGTQEVTAKLGNSYLDSQSFHQYDFTIVTNTSKTMH